MRRLAAALLLSTALVAATVPPSQAVRMPAARQKVVGGCIYHRTTHVLTCIAGTYRFERQLRRHGTWKTFAFYGPVISAQRCKLGKDAHCWGTVKHGPLVSKLAPGRAVPKTSGRSTATAPKVNYCWVRVCTNPFFWLDGVAKGVQDVQDFITDPCQSGAAKGFGGGLLGNLVAKVMLEAGALSRETAIAKMANPESMAYLSVLGCVGLVADHGTDSAKVWYERMTD